MVVPPWQSPDEPTHFEYAQVLANQKNLFNSPQPDTELQKKIIDSMDAYNFWLFLDQEKPQPLPENFRHDPFLKIVPTQIGRKPPLYYFIASFLLRLFPQQPLIFQFYLLRIFSLLLTLGSILIIFKTAQLIIPEDYYFQLTTAAWAAFLPQFILIGTSVSLDPLANLLGISFLYLMVKIQVRGFNLSRLLLSFLIIIAAILVTYKCLELIPIFFFAMAITAIGHFRKKGYWRYWLLGFAGSVVILTVLYSALTWSSPQTARIFLVRVARLFGNIEGFMRGDLHLASYYYPWFNLELFRSFWIKYGWAHYTLRPEAYYLVLKGVSIVALIGIFILFLKFVFVKKAFSPGFKRSVFILIFSLMVVLAGYYGYWGLKWEFTTAQGRHLFLALSAWAILFVLGWREIVPEKGRTGLYLCLLSVFILLDGLALFGFILPTFSS